MSSSNRATKINKIQRVIKKHYKAVSPPDRPILEHLLYACCLENAAPEQADEAFAKLQKPHFFDWNEVRVTTIAELAEVMSMLPDPKEAANRVRRSLQSLFEAHYSFDLDFFRKQGLGKSVQQLSGLDGVTPFVVAYVTQRGLAGHAIPVNRGALEIMRLLEVISDNEALKYKVPGLERTIAKTKGAEFGSLLQQLGADYHNTPHSPRVRNILIEIDASVKDRLPKRKKPAEKPAKKAAKKTPEKKTANKEAEKPAKKTAKKAAKKPAKKAAKAKPSPTKKKATKKAAKRSATKKLAKKKPR